MTFIPAAHFYNGRLKAVRLIVIHCTVSPEVGGGAEAVANYFRTTTRRASAHRVVDNNSMVQCVRDFDTAFGAAGANADGLHLELIGYPNQSTAEWEDIYSTAMFKVAAPTLREWTEEFHVPWRWLTVDQVADRQTMGFCTHADVSRAFPDVSTGHWDPGPNFPKSYAMGIWKPTTPPIPIPTPPTTKDDDMAFTLISPASGKMWLIEPGAMTLIPDEDKDNHHELPALGKVSDTYFKRIDASHTRYETP